MRASAGEQALRGRGRVVADDVIIIGRTNRSALLEGATDGLAATPRWVTREDAVRWVRSELVPGDVVLYENDLPDHYP